MPTTTNAERDQELQLLRSGKAFHVHRDVQGNVVEVGKPPQRFCTSPYCVDLTPEGFRGGPNA